MQQSLRRGARAIKHNLGGRAFDESGKRVWSPLMDADNSSLGDMPAGVLPPGQRADDESWMRMALEQAACGVSRTAPNPPVGAVIV